MTAPTSSFIPSGPLVHAPVPPPPPRKRHPVRNTILVILLLSILGVVSLVVFEPRFNSLVYRAIAQRFLSAELRQALYISDGDSVTQVVHMKGPTTFALEPMGGKLVSLDARASYAAIVATKERYEVRTAKDLVYTDVRPLAGVSRSPDGRYVAVARQGTTTGALVPNPTQWSIVLIDTVQKTTRELGSGIAPLFLDGTRLIYIRSNGMISYDVVKGTEKVLSDHVFEGTGFGGFSSDDRLRMGWVDTTRKEITIYKVDTGNAEVVATVPAADNDLSYALGKEGIYILRKGADGETELWYGRYGAPVARMMTLPSQLGVTRIGIGAI